MYGPAGGGIVPQLTTDGAIGTHSEHPVPLMTEHVLSQTSFPDAKTVGGAAGAIERVAVTFFAQRKGKHSGESAAMQESMRPFPHNAPHTGGPGGGQ